MMLAGFEPATHGEIFLDGRPINRVPRGALLAFITSFDEIVIVLFVAGVEQREMWSGIREQISPTILTVATVLVMVSIALLTTIELLRRRTERMRGIAPG